MKWVESIVRQPVTVAVGVLLVLLSGVIALQRIAIQLTPNVEDTVVAVTTRWEGASPQEVEQEIVDEQEDKLQGIANLRAMTSTSQQAQGRVKLEFNTGTPKDVALREVSDKLREVPEYPENAFEPVVEASDPDTRDYIAWVLFETTDDDFDIRTLQDFADDRIKPALERIAGMSEVNVLGGREREVQVLFDPVRLANRGVSVADFISAIQRTNRNVSAGAVEESKSNVRLRFVAQYEAVDEVLDTVVAQTAGGPLYVRDVAEVEETFKEARSFVRASGRSVIAINFSKEVGANVMTVMEDLDRKIEGLNAPGGLLETQAKMLGLDGTLKLKKVYDQTIYIDDALALVQSNIWLGGGIAIVVLLLFLRSIRSAGIIALAIPISIVGAIVFMVAAGRSINVISLAGMAFAIGMVVDNAIVVLENIFRHLEMGKSPTRASVEGTKEVLGAVVASTLTTVVVFIPILLIQEEAGQLFRDIALAIVAAVTLSLVTSVTVIPAASARLLKRKKEVNAETREEERRVQDRRKPSRIRRALRWFASPSDSIADFIHWLSGSVLARVLVVLLLTLVSVWGTKALLPPSDYLPQGNRNLVFGLIIPPPGYSLDQQEILANRIEDTIRPYWEADQAGERGSEAYEKARAALPEVSTFDFAAMKPGPNVQPPPIENYFLVSFDGIMFHGAIAAEPEEIVDIIPLFAEATRADQAPGVLAFAFQLPLFQLGGTTGSAVKVNFSGDDLDQVAAAAQAVYMQLVQPFGFGGVQPDPSNFNIPGPELQVVPDLRRLAEAGVSPADLGRALQALGDGAIIGDYRVGGQTIDLKVLAQQEKGVSALDGLSDEPLATVNGPVPLSALADLIRVNAPPQINREGRQRSVTLQVTAPPGMPLQQAIDTIASTLDGARASGVIGPGVETSFTGSASKLAAVQNALLGDGTLAGTLGSSLVLALLVTYLLMCVLFQSFLRPLIILFSVPLATFGGFAALYGVHVWSQVDRYMPVQNLDVLTMLGFVILIGVVVNNAILIVHQSLNFMRGGEGEGEGDEPMPPRKAISEAVRSRVRPIFMSTLTSVGGMAPLVLMPGSGSELYRGLGSVVVGGLLVSTIFTLLLVPLLLSLVTDVQAKLGLLSEARRDQAGSARPALAGGAGVFLLASSLLLGGCQRPLQARSFDGLSRAAESRSSSLEDSPQTARSLPLFDATPVERALEDRRDELQAMGDPASFAYSGGAEASLTGQDLGGSDQRVVTLSLDRALASAALHNLNLRLAELDPAIAEEGIIVAESDFDFVLFAEGTYDRVDEPNLVPVIGGVALGAAQARNDSGTITAGARKLLGTGGTFELSTFLQRFDNRLSGIDFLPDPAWSSGLTARIDQPLLRGFGSDVTRLNVELSENERERSVHAQRSELLAVLSLVEIAYWDLHEAWGRLAVAKSLLDQGAEVERVLEARRSFDAEAAQYSDALATLEQRRADLVRAQRTVRANSDGLKRLLLDPELSLEGELLLAPETLPSQTNPDLNLRDAIATALDERPELAAALVAIEDARLIEEAAKNALLPQLDLSLAVTAAGLDDRASDSFESLAEDDFVGILAGLRFELPAGNRGAKAQNRQARLRARAALLRYENALKTVVLEVKDRLRDLATARELATRTRSLRLAAAENLRTLRVEKEERSRLTPEFLSLEFQRQAGLASAQTQEIVALADAERALAAFHRAIGRGPGGEVLVLE